jgi:exonuclease SbcD
MVLAGDIWDRGIAVDERSPLMPVVRLIRGLAEHMPVIIVKGNHDRPGSLDIFSEIKAKHDITVAEKPMLVYEAGIAWMLMPYPTKAYLMSQTDLSQEDGDRIASGLVEQVVRGLAAELHESKNPRVLVFHGNVTGAQTESGQTMLGGDIMVSAAALESASGAEYVALGHIHKRQQIGRCYYPGSLYHCNFGELEPKSMNIVTIHDVKVPGSATEPIVTVESVPLPSRPKVMLECVWHGDMIEFSSEGIASCDGADVKARVRMTEEQAATFDEGEVRELYMDAGAHSVRVERIIIPRERVRSEAVAGAQKLRDKVSAWGASIGEEIPVGVLEKADAVEMEEAI